MLSVSWSWVDGSDWNDTFAQKMWGHGQPDEYGKDTDCLEIWQEGGWNDERCDQVNAFICKKGKENIKTLLHKN